MRATAWMGPSRRSSSAADQDRDVVTALAVNALLGTRLATGLFNQRVPRVPDDRYLAEWTALLANRIRVSG
ncbi:hypothetical protein [Mycolicibacterium sp. P1-5]|uniref:hypothetical protein n=1 Tax=Mycolicibacterium sp. P1-5 TaxID=2024617 RepID=UPI001D1560EC|nr:hypothetical protein [Mycolicibacterium sp. P1-5]